MKTLTSVIKAFLLASLVLLWGTQAASAGGSSYVKIDADDDECKIDDDNNNVYEKTYQGSIKINNNTALCFFQDGDVDPHGSVVNVESCWVEDNSGNHFTGNGTYHFLPHGMIQIICHNLTPVLVP